MKQWGRTTVFTPQVIVGGVADGTGAVEGEVMEIVRAAREARVQMPWYIVIDTNDTELMIDSN